MFLIICNNKQGQKRQPHKKQKKVQNKFKSSRIYNRQISHINSNDMDNSKNTLYQNDISCNNNHENLHQNILKIDKTIATQIELIRTNNSSADYKHMANYQQIIKPCFVKLNVRTVQDYILNRKKLAENKRTVPHKRKFLYTDTLQTNKNISKMQNTISQSISTEYNDFGGSKHMPVKQCSVTLCDNVKDWYVLKNKKNMKNTTNIRDKSNISHLVFHNSSEIAPNCNKKIELALYDTKKDRKDLLKDGFVEVERLKIREFLKENGTVFNEKEQNIICSTPINKRIKPSTCLMIYSPINSNIYDKLHWSQECLSKENISNSERKNSCSLIMMSDCYKLDPIDIQKQHTQLLLSSKKSQMSKDSAINKVTPYKDDILAVTQKYETECNVETGIPYSLNISTINNDQSRSLFGDTTYNYSAKNTVGDDTEKNFLNVLSCKFVKIDTVDSSVDLCLKQKQLLSEQADASSRHISPSKVHVTFRDLDTVHMRQKYEENYSTEINTIKVVHENLKDETVNISKHSLLDKNQDNIVDARVLLTRLQDPIRIGRRIRYPKWHLSMSNISNSLNNEATQSNNEIFRYVTTDKVSNIQSTAYNSEHSKNIINSSLDHSSFNGMTQPHNDINKEIEKSVFLKPGKYWARSLSILNNINDRSNLEKLSIGKGKKWRHSVRDILDMQKQGNFLYYNYNNNNILRNIYTWVHAIMQSI